MHKHNRKQETEAASVSFVVCVLLASDLPCQVRFQTFRWLVWMFGWFCSCCFPPSTGLEQGGGCDLRLSASFSAGIDNKSVRSSYINLWLLWVDEFSTTIWHQSGLARDQWVCEWVNERECVCVWLGKLVTAELLLPWDCWLPVELVSCLLNNTWWNGLGPNTAWLRHPLQVPDQ